MVTQQERAVFLFTGAESKFWAHLVIKLEKSDFVFNNLLTNKVSAQYVSSYCDLIRLMIVLYLTPFRH